jgi:transposase
MLCLYLGIDVSKGYADFCFTDPDGRRLPGSGRYDDTTAGHAAVRQALSALADRYAPTPLRFEIGLEASGGLERNWLAFLRSLTQDTDSRVFHLNPLAVRRFLEQRLHYSITDARSAAGIAAYLRAGERRRETPLDASDPDRAGSLVLYRFLCNTIDRATALQNELHALLPAVHPEVVRYCRSGFPEWVLRLLICYPTAPVLARASVEGVAGIPYVSPEKARTLIAAAKESVAALRQPQVGATITLLAQEILRHQEQIAQLKEQLIAALREDRACQVLRSLPGIGAWTAVLLRLEIGDFARFHSAEALVAYAGLDPRYHQSGDGTTGYCISKRGRREIRAALYMNVLTALRGESVIRSYYERLMGRRDCHAWAITACMAKLLRLAYACVVGDKEFDPGRYAADAARQAAGAASAAAKAAPDPERCGVLPLGAPPLGALEAPVSRREARRRAAIQPQVGGAQRARGPGAALTHHTPSGRVRQLAEKSA